jgi:hypothetical protein
LQQLGFCECNSDDDDSNIDECETRDSIEVGKSWLVSFGAVIDGSIFITKDSEIKVPDTKKKNSLI